MSGKQPAIATPKRAASGRFVKQSIGQTSITNSLPKVGARAITTRASATARAKLEAPEYLTSTNLSKNPAKNDPGRDPVGSPRLDRDPARKDDETVVSVVDEAAVIAKKTQEDWQMTLDEIKAQKDGGMTEGMDAGREDRAKQMEKGARKRQQRTSMPGAEDACHSAEAAGESMALAADKTEKGCPLLRLPPGLLLSRIWPSERVVSAMQVCNVICRELLQSPVRICLVRSPEAMLPNAALISEEVLAKDIRRLSHHEVSLEWRPLPKTGTCLPDIKLLSVAVGECKGLVSLDLWNNWIGGGTKDLAKSIGRCRALTHLDVSFNGIGNVGLRSIATALVNCKGLVSLNLSANALHAWGMEMLVPVLRECTALAHLDLSRNDICCSTGDGVAVLEGVLGECKALAHLDLSSNHIGDVGAGKLAGVLKKCEQLTDLGLSNNGIGAEGAERLAGVLGECKTLAGLCLNDNRVGDDGVQRIAGVLGDCGMLADVGLRIWIRRNGVSAEGGAVLEALGGSGKVSTFW